MSVVTLLAVGDIWLSTKNDREPFERIIHEFTNKDILIGNLETVISTNGRALEKAHVLHVPPESAAYLRDAGFDVVSIANNHTLDLGEVGFANMIHALEKNEILAVGGGLQYEPPPIIIEKNGIKFGFLAYTEGLFRVPPGVSFKKINRNRMIRDINDLKPKCDHIIVSLHWGVEHVYYPSDRQIQLAHTLIDNGATVILGSGPHAIQGIEEYNTGLIAYSLGNFQFDPTPPHQKDTMTTILQVTFDSGGIRDHRAVPCNIDSDYLPFPADGRDAEAILHHIAKTSEWIASGRITKEWWYEEIAKEFLSSHLESFRKRIREHGVLPLAECAVWSLTPFCLNCYLALIRKKTREFKEGIDK